MVWGFSGFGRLIGGDHDSDDDRHRAPQKLTNSDRHAAVMAEAAALGLMDTKPEPVKRLEKPPDKVKERAEAERTKATKAPERAAASEPSGDSSRHAGSPASTEEAEHKVKKKKKKGKHRHSELPGELSAEGTSEASPQVLADFDQSWQANAGFGNFGGAGFGNDFGTGFGFGGGGFDQAPEMGQSDLGWGQPQAQVLEAPPATSRRSPRRQTQPTQVLESPPVQATSRRSPRQQMQPSQMQPPQMQPLQMQPLQESWAMPSTQEWQARPPANPSPTGTRSAVDISWALPADRSVSYPATGLGNFGGSRSPRKAVDISWAMRPQPARALRRMASPRGEAAPIQRDEAEVMASQRALAEEAAAAAAAKTLAQAEEVSRRRDEIVERLAKEIRDLKEKLANVSPGPQPVDLKAFGAHPGTPTPTSMGAWGAQSWEELPKEGDAWSTEKSKTMSRQDSKDIQDGSRKHRKDKERHSRHRQAAEAGANQWPEAQVPSVQEIQRSADGSNPPRKVSGGLPADQPDTQPSGFGDLRSTPTMHRQRSSSGEMKSTPMMRRASGEMRLTPTLQRNGSTDVQNGFGDLRSTPTMHRQRSSSGETKLRTSVANDEAWVIEEDRMEKYRSVFTRADVDGDGFVEPPEAKAVLLKSNLPEDELAQIYSLADVDKDGRLNEGEFLCALHLAYKRTKEGLLPAELPGPLLALTQRSDVDWSVKAEELGHYLQTFQRLDAQSRGIVGQEEGREIFERSGLPVQELSFIWQLSDRDADGSLAFQEFAMAMAIVARRRRGWSLPTALPAALVRSVESFSPVSWAVSAGELESYRSLFQRVDRNGVADLAATKDLLEKSQLPVSELSAIYAMSDLDHDGRLSEPEFLCAMAMAARRCKGAPLPEQLPSELREACWSMPSTQAEVAPNHPQEAQSLWQPTHEELSRFQQLFAQLQEHGFVSADRAREVLESSGLPLDDLAKIWDLADAGDDGKLDLGEFFCAMSLSARRREGHELPQSLPDELLPFLRLRDLETEMQRYLAMFQEQVPRGANMPADRAREILEMSELPPSDLAQIWRLSGATDGLDSIQFLHAMALTARRRQGHALPTSIPPDLLLAAQLV